jgi:phosphoribosylaminoimidazole-succinocarboxamide synthase
MRQPVQSVSEEPGGKVLQTVKGGLIGERHGKYLFHSERPGLIIQEFGGAAGENGKKNSRPHDLSTLRNEISSYLFEYLEGFHIPTHFVGLLSPTQMLVRSIEPIPMAVRIYNGGSTELAKRFGFKEGVTLEFPVIEHYYVGENGLLSWINEYHVYGLGIATPDEFRHINRIASKVNAVLRGLCDRRQLMLQDFQIEFGRYKGQIVLGDELSPTTCHFLDLSANEKDGQSRFLSGGEDALMAIIELRDRLKLRV